MAGLVRFDPFAGLTNLHSQIDDMFGDLMSSTPPAANLAAMDIYSEDEKSLTAEIHVPGFEQDDIDVRLTDDGVLEVRGQKQTKDESKKKRSYMLRESSASFYRRVALPKNVDGAAIRAHYENGVLKIQIPFKELPQPKKVQITSGKSKK